MVRRIVWSKLAQKHLLKIYEYILEDSYQNAQKVVNEIYNSAEVLATHPEKFNLDKYKLKNDGSFRAYEIFNYRISYKINVNDIVIARVRHTKMEPNFR